MEQKTPPERKGKPSDISADLDVSVSGRDTTDEAPMFARDSLSERGTEDDAPTLIESRESLKESAMREEEARSEAMAAFLVKGTLLARRYEVRSALGRGGMGAVYRVWDRKLKEEIALKVFLPSLLIREKAVERFYNEAKVSRKLSHRNIIRVFDFGEDELRGIRFITMELIQGMSLREWINEKKEKGEEIPAQEALEIVEEILEGLEYAHKFTIHRDLKPENIMLTEEGRIVIMDFGLAKILSPSKLTSTSMAMGTAYYMPPEQQLDAAKVDARADIFSMGVILYELLTGDLPVGRFKTPTEKREALPKELDPLILKSLQEKPEDRYASVMELLGEIRKITEALPKQERPRKTSVLPAIAMVLIVALGALAYVFRAPLRELFVPQSSDKEPIVQKTAGTPEEEAKVRALSPEDLWWAPTAEQKAYSLRTKQRLYIENSIGMKLVLIPPGAFMMGSPASERERRSDETRHRVTLSKGFYLGATEVTNGQYRRFKANHDSKDYKGHSLNGDEQPVVYVSWNDAVAFCDWLTAEERRAGKIGSRDSYRLPTEAEWEYACRAGTTTSRFWGDGEYEAKDYCNAIDPPTKKEFGWGLGSFPEDDGFRVTAPVGSFKPNAFGLYDMIGNVWEWCREWYGPYPSGSVANPEGPGRGSSRLVRGGSWHCYPWYCRSSDRRRLVPDYRSNYYGLRVVLVRAGARTPSEKALRPSHAKKTEAAKKFSEEKAKTGALIPEGFWWTPTPEQKAYALKTKQPLAIENSLGMKLVLIPPGTFLMGSPASEEGRQAEEVPHRVTLTRGFYMGATEVTNEQYRKCKPKHSSRKFEGHDMNGKDQPAIFLSWKDAINFCEWLAITEKKEGTIRPGMTYRLPTEAEWEYACRAGTGTPRFWGDNADQAKHYCNSSDPVSKKKFGWEKLKCFPHDDGHRVTAPAGSFKPNAFGLYDMLGNVMEWCLDWYKEYPTGHVTDPQGPERGRARVVRGGAWFDESWKCRSAFRDWNLPMNRLNNGIGFRVVLVRAPSTKKKKPK
jgi:formylglycine-generating enzyme required for sulfatase activity/predicted Ser/Thr protein kinase